MRWLPLLLLAAVAFSATTGGPSGPVAVGPGQPAARPAAAAPPSIADQLGAIADRLNFLAITHGTVGSVSGPLGRDCKEARERMRWSDLPCSPYHLPPLVPGPAPVRDPY